MFGCINRFETYFYSKIIIQFILFNGDEGVIYQELLVIPSPGGVINVLLTFDNISPSLNMPIPSLLALPSKPIARTNFF